MKYKKRLLTQKIRQMIEHFPVLIVTGARQVGKSTLLKKVFPEWKMIVFDSVIDVGNVRLDPDLFLDNHPSPVILDEIQYAPELVSSIKRRVDSNRKNGMYILTGSQQWSVMRSISEPLAGRAVVIELSSFSLSEINEVINPSNWLFDYLDAPCKFVEQSHDTIPMIRTINEQLWRGFLPDADSHKLEWISDFHRSYFQTYVERDVRLMGDVNDWQQFGRFVQLVAVLTGQEINASHFGRDIGITPQTAKRWLAILTATFQWFNLPSFHGNAVKRISRKSKGYFLDTGLICNLQRISSPEALSGHPLTGSLFETAIVGEILKLMNSTNSPANMYHWRSHGGAEVDILLERDGIFYPIEVKLRSNPSRRDTRGIKQFRETYDKFKVAPGLVICPVKSIQRLSETDYCLPWNCR
ncbi:DUF4143 domain-containing protein [bacterium]|nr:DUF4143 domain-containing protein [bacterium]